MLPAEIALNLQGVLAVAIDELLRQLLAVETAQSSVVREGETGHAAGVPVAVHLGADQWTAARVEEIIAQLPGRVDGQGFGDIVLVLDPVTRVEGVVTVVVVDEAPASPACLA